MFAHILSPTAIDRNPPRSAIIDGAFVCGTLPREYLATLGYYPLVETPAPAPAEGCHVEPRYALVGGEVVQSWAQVENPPPGPRVFSKLKIVSALMSANLWDQAKAYIEGAGLYDLYLAAVTFREDNPYFKQGLKDLQDALGVPDVQVKEILAASVAD